MTACLGSGTYTQANAIMSSIEVTFGVQPIITDAVLTILVAVIILGGLQSIAKAAEKIVPGMAVLYIVSVVALLVVYADRVPDAVALIIHDAFNPYGSSWRIPRCNCNDYYSQWYCPRYLLQ